jgi:hypothetical protein
MAKVERFPFRRVYANDRQFKEYLSFWRSSGMTERHARGVAILCKEIDNLTARIRRLERKRKR